MKNLKLKYILLTLALIVLGSLLFIAKAEPARAGYEHNISGWTWTETGLGWMSLNNISCIGIPECGPQGESYGLNINDATGELNGWTWTYWKEVDKGEWICFGTTCNQELDSPTHLGQKIEPNIPPTCNLDGECTDTEPYPTFPGGRGAKATYNKTTKEITGWARTLSTWDDGYWKHQTDPENNDYGWIHLRGFAQTGEEYGIALDSDTHELRGWAHSSTYGPINFSIYSRSISGKVTDTAGTPIVAIARVIARKKDAPLKDFTRMDITGAGGAYRIFALVYGCYDVTATATGYKSKTETNVCFTGPTNFSEEIENINFELETSVPLAGKITGVVYQDTYPPPNGNGAFDSTEDLRIATASVYTIEPLPLYQYSTQTYVDGTYTLPVELEGTGYKVCAVSPTHDENCWPSNIDDGAIDINIALTPRGVGPYAGFPWLHTWWSDVHSNVEVGVEEMSSPPPGTAYANATYLITAETGIATKFISFEEQREGRKGRWEIGAYRDMGFPGEIGEGDLVFSPIDIDKLKVGATTITESSRTPDSFGSGSGVWYKASDLTIKSGKFQEGAKMIIVDGNLIIEGNILYKLDSFSKDTLPSVGFIVRDGNVIVEGGLEGFPEGVDHIVGAYYVDRTDHTDKGKIIIETANPSPPDTHDKHLLCEGLMVAREFEFQRNTSAEDWIACRLEDLAQCTVGSPYLIHKYYYPDAPSILIYYDSRVVVNTPKGFEDFSKALPSWEER